MRMLLRIGLVAGAALLALPSPAEPLVPARDDQVVEILPAMPGRAAVARAARSAHDAAVLARGLIEQARATGDPRPVGQAMSALQRWADAPDASPEAVLMMATAEQYVHDFDRAMQRLKHLVARDTQNPQAWLTLATLERLKGRYDESDRDCSQLLVLGVSLHAQACLAENASLRGQSAPARAALQRLIAVTRDGGTRNWLLTTLAEVEDRDGRAGAAESAYRDALAAQADAYTAIDFADFLIRQHRGAEARALLLAQPRSDAVLLRIALADPGDAQGRGAAAELRERFAQAAERPGAAVPHARERAMYALHVAHDARAALALARLDLKLQREPADLLVMAEAASAARDPVAQQEVRHLAEEIGLHDHRIDEVL